MKAIDVVKTKPNMRMMYRLANTQSQRALVGYIAKKGMTHNPIFGAAFNMLHNIELCMNKSMIYAINPLEDIKTMNKIVGVVQSALDGKYDMFAFSQKEVNNIILCLEMESN